MLLRLILPAALFLASTFTRGADGDLDNTFGTGGITTVARGSGCTITCMQMQSGGRIVSAGHVQSGGVAGRDGCLMRFTSTGQLDSTFGSSGVVTTDFGTTFDWLNSVLILDKDVILAAGFNATSTGPATPVIARYTADGVLDATFGTAGKLIVSRLAGRFGSSLLPAADGGFYLGTYSGDVLKFKSDGTVDSNYGTNGLASTNISSSTARGCLAPGPDNSLFVGGARYINGNSRSVLAKLTPQGFLDSSFGTGGIVENNVSADYYDSYDVIEYDPDSHTVLALGGVNGGNVPTAYKVVLSRFKDDGKSDSQMGEGGTAILEFGPLTNLAHDFRRLPDGRLLICASYQEGDSGTCILSRRLANGSPDLSFAQTGYVSRSFGGASQAPACMILQPNFKVLVAGYSYIGGAQRAALMRLEHEPVTSSRLQVFRNGTKLYPWLTSTLDFGRVDMDGGTSTLRITLKNSGDTSLTGLSAVIQQEGAEFGNSQGSGVTWTLAAGESRDLDITFASSSLGDYSGILRLVSTTEPDSPFELGLKGSWVNLGVPVITTQPRSTLIIDRANVLTYPEVRATLSVVADNELALPQSYQWYVNDKPVRRATSPQLALTRDSMEGVYTVKIMTSSGVTTSRPAYVAAMLHDSETVTAVNGTQTIYAYQGNPASLPIDVRLPSGTTLNYAWINASNTPLQEGSSYTGVKTSTLGIASATSETRGRYLCAASLKDDKGLLLASGSFLTYLEVLGPPQIFTFQPSFNLEPGIEINLTSDMMKLNIENRPTRYDVSGLPPGLRVSSSSPTSLVFSGTPTAEAVPGKTYHVTIGVFSPAGYNQTTLVFSMVRPTLGGSYQGLASAYNLESPTSDRNTGLLQFTVTDKGAVSGTFLLSGIRRSFKAAEVTRGSPAYFALPAQGSLPASTLKLEFLTSGSSGSGALYPGSQTSTEATHFINFDRSAFTEWTIERKEAIQGRYNVVLETTPLGTEAFPLPLGHGVLSVVVSRSGTAVWSGKLPDGQALGGSCAVLGQEVPRIYLHASLYQNTGSFGTALDWVADLEAVSEKLVGGTAAWNKPPRKSDASYPEGFITQMQLMGMNYTPPGKGRTFMNLRPVPVSESNADVTILLEDAEPVFVPVRFTGPGSAAMVNGSTRLRLFPAGSTGLIQGDILFRQQDPVNPKKFHQRTGILLGIINPDSTAGVYGFIGMPSMPVAGKATRWLSGAVRITGNRSD